MTEAERLAGIRQNTNEGEPMTYTDEQVSDALNRAADDVLEAIDAPDQGARDAINLVVNAGLHYLKREDGDLSTAIAANYQIEADDDGPLEWARDNL